MSGWSEMAKDIEQGKFVRKYAPDPLPALTEDNLRWNIARANKAEAELKTLRDALQGLQRVLRDL